MSNPVVCLVKSVIASISYSRYEAALRRLHAAAWPGIEQEFDKWWSVHHYSDGLYSHGRRLALAARLSGEEHHLLRRVTSWCGARKEAEAEYYATIDTYENILRQEGVNPNHLWVRFNTAW